MGWGGVIGSAIAGAAMGVGQAGYDDVVERQKNEAIAQRDAMLARLREEESIRGEERKIANMPRVAKAEAEAYDLHGKKVAQDKIDMESKAKKNALRDVAPDHDVYDPETGKVVYSAPAKEDTETPTQKSLREQQMAESKARIAHIQSQIESEKDRRGKEGSKHPLPDIMSGDLDGKKTMVDRKSGAKFNESEQMWYTSGGKKLPNGLADLPIYKNSGLESIDLPGAGAPTKKGESGETVREVSGKIGGGKPAATGGSLTPGMVKNGFRFKGGNPNSQANWEPV